MRAPARLALAALVTLVAGGCGGKRSTDTGSAPRPFRIGIMTGTSAQGEEDFRAGEQVERKYPGRVRHITYPDDFPSEVETVVAQLTGLAADPEIKVIVVGQAIPGSVAAARRIRASRPDILIGLIQPHEDPDTIAAVCDLAIQPDQDARGVAIVETAQRMGATSLVHYSFARHLGLRKIRERRDIMKRECAARGMAFFGAIAPDPAGEEDLSALRQFIMEDVPRRLARLGPATAFYGTNDGMQEPLIRAILAAKAGYFVEQDAPAPTAGFPAALGLRMPADSAGDMAYVSAENARAIASRGMSGHFGTWKQPVDMVTIRACTGLLVDAAEHRADLRDSATVQRYLDREAGGPVRMRRYGPQGNEWLVLMEHITY